MRHPHSSWDEHLLLQASVRSVVHGRGVCYPKSRLDRPFRAGTGTTQVLRAKITGLEGGPWSEEGYGAAGWETWVLWSFVVVACTASVVVCASPGSIACAAHALHTREWGVGEMAARVTVEAFSSILQQTYEEGGTALWNE